MKKITKKKNFLQKAVAMAIVCIGLNQTLNAQCSTSFTYTTTSSSISATSTSTATTAATSYYWTLANPSGGVFNSSYATTPVFNSLYNGNYILTLSLDSASGGTCPVVSQTITVSGGTNAPSCSSSFTYTLGASGAANFTNTSPADPLNNDTYNWNFSNTGNAYVENPTFTYYYNGTYTVSLIVNNPVSGCSIASSQTVSISNANTLPTCTSNFTYTLGASGQVDFTSLYSGSATLDSSSIRWDFGDGYNSYDSIVNLSHTYSYNGIYNVTLYVNDPTANCYSSTTQTISITNTATQPCVANVTFSMHQDTLNPQPGVWEVSTYYSPQVTNAVWSWGDGTYDTGLSPTHTYTVAGLYNICVNAYASCGDSSFVCQNDSLYRAMGMISVTVLNVNNVAAGIKTETQQSAQVSVYPNPSAGVFTLNLTNVSAASAQIVLTNILGEVVYSSQETVNNNAVSKEINLQNIANGAYFMKVNMSNKAYTTKIIISK